MLIDRSGLALPVRSEVELVLAPLAAPGWRRAGARTCVAMGAVSLLWVEIFCERRTGSSASRDAGASQDRRPVEALTAAERFLDLVGTPQDPELRSLTSSVSVTGLSIKSHLQLLRQAAARLIETEPSRSRVPAAAAQLWLVVALMYSGDPRDIVIQANTFQKMGEPALRAADQLIRQWSKGAYWRRALMTAISLKIETLEWLGRHDDAGRHQQLFIKLFDGSDLPGVQVVVDEYQTEAGTP